MRKMQRLKGVVDRVTGQVVTVVPDNRAREVYLPLASVPEAQEGMAVDLIIVPAEDPNGLATVFGKKPKPPAKPMKMASFASLVKAMLKVRDRLRATVAELEKGDTPSREVLDAHQEKIEWLDRGIDLFS